MEVKNIIYTLEIKKFSKKGRKLKTLLEGDRPPKFIDKQTIFIQYISDLPKAVKTQIQKNFRINSK